MPMASKVLSIPLATISKEKKKKKKKKSVVDATGNYFSSGLSIVTLNSKYLRHWPLRNCVANCLEGVVDAIGNSFEKKEKGKKHLPMASKVLSMP